MSETTVINLFTVARVLILGCILLVLPLITRKGLLFGAYVGEAVAERPAARALVRHWCVGCALLMGLTLAVSLGISVAGYPIAGNLSSVLLLLASTIALYLRYHVLARRLEPAAGRRPAEIGVASIRPGRQRSSAFATIALGICVLAGLITVGYATYRYPEMPERIPTHFGASGDPDAWSDKSVFAVMFAPTLNLVTSPFLALFALLTAHAKRSVRGGTGGHSAEAQEAFRAAMANLLSGIALLTCALLTLVSVQSIRVALGQTGSLGTAVWWITIGMLLFTLGGLIRIIVKYGQGGARLEQGSNEAPLTDGLADNSRWVWGMFYVNRDDPSILVEKRFGIGYTVNFGNRTAVLIVVGFLVLIIALAAWGRFS